MKRTRSIRRRLARWTFAATAATIAALTAATVAVQRSVVLDLQKAAGEALLAHLATMPDLQGESVDVRRAVAAISDRLHASGSRLELAPASGAPSSGIVATRHIDLSDGAYELRYGAEDAWIDEVTRRTVLLHVLHGAIALGVLVLGAEWILRTRLVAPLRGLAHQVRFMASGGGWSPHLPEADAELGEVRLALAEMGPALHAQVVQWVEAERRAGAMAVTAALREKLKEPSRRVLAIAGDMQARGSVGPMEKRRMRELVRDVERIGREIRSIEDDSCAPPASVG